MWFAVMQPPSSEDAVGPPELLLLDTCVVQNLEWVYAMQDTTDSPWTKEDEAGVVGRYGQRHAHELFSLWCLVDMYEARGDYPPWLVSANSANEFEAHGGSRRNDLHNGWRYWRGLAEDRQSTDFGSVAPGLLYSGGHRPNPLILRGLGVESIADVIADGGPLQAFSDLGDRKLLREAMFAGVDAVLTTDVRTLWSKRVHVAEYGVSIWLPSALLAANEREWAGDHSGLSSGLGYQDDQRTRNDGRACSPDLLSRPPSQT